MLGGFPERCLRNSADVSQLLVSVRNLEPSWQYVYSANRFDTGK